MQKCTRAHTAKLNAVYFFMYGIFRSRKEKQKRFRYVQSKNRHKRANIVEKQIVKKFLNIFLALDKYHNEYWTINKNIIG